MITLEQLKEAIHKYDAPYLSDNLNGVTKPVMYVSWRTAGASGGSCWGHKPKEIRREEEPIDDFQEQALKIYEYITGHEIKDDEADMYLLDVYKNSINGTDSESGYYGNWSESETRYIYYDIIYNLVYSHSRAGRIDDILSDLKEQGL